jgi:integrase
MVLLDFGTGLRRGELSGVRWEDIRFDDKVLIPEALNRETAHW